MEVKREPTRSHAFKNLLAVSILVLMEVKREPQPDPPTA